jgi:hypothetical protein
MATELATANPASSDVGSDSATLATDLENPESLDFDEQEDANEEADEQGTDDNSETDEGETQEAADPEEASTDENEAENAESDKDQPAVKDDVIVEVQGEKLPLSELKSGYMKDRDYRIKTQELGNKRRELETLTSRVTDSVNAIADLLVAQAPKMPDISLAVSDPAKYVQEKAIHEAAMAQINAVVAQATAPKEVANKLTDEQRSEYLQSENAKLAEAFPQTAKPETRKKFFDDAISTAKELGYSDEEIKGATDHRLFKLAHYARLGMAAEKSAAKAKTKVANVPPMAPAKRQPVNGKARANQEAMKRLDQTGSMQAAMAVDFD